MGNHNIKSFEDMLRNMLDPTSLLERLKLRFVCIYLFDFFLRAS